MGTPSFGLLPGNNAPPPPVFAGNNPTGGLVNNNKGVNTNFPNYPMFGNPHTTGVVSPMSNMPAFSATNMQGLSTGLAGPLSGMPGNPGDHLYKELVRAYGKGTGASLFQMLTAGQFNPQTASAFLNAMQPGVARGESSLLNAFGAEGSRFGSAAGLGLGDYESQVNLNEQQTLASLYMNAQQEQLSLLSGILPTLHQEEADSGGGIFGDILGGLEIAGGIAMEFVPGLQVPGAGLISGGVGTLSGSNKGSGGSKTSAPTMQMPQYGNGNYDIGKLGGTPPFLATQQSERDFWETYDLNQLTASAGDILGGNL
jgi:hypothetical protein